MQFYLKARQQGKSEQVRRWIRYYQSLQMPLYLGVNNARAKLEELAKDYPEAKIKIINDSLIEIR